MFWIGMIVGIVIAILIGAAVFAWALWTTKTSLTEFGEMNRVIGDALYNRKAYLQAFTDEEVLSTVVLEEK